MTGRHEIVIIVSVILQHFVQPQTSSHSTEFCTSRKLVCAERRWGGVGGGRMGGQGGGGGQGGLPFLQGAFDAHLAAPCHVAILPF